MDFDVNYIRPNKEKKPLNIKVNEKENQLTVAADDQSEIIDAAFIADNTISLIIDGKSYLATVVKEDDRKVVYLNGREYIFEEKAEESIEVGEDDVKRFNNIIKSPMPGSVVKIGAQEGDTVKEGQVLIIVEAMKMENEIRAPIDVLVDEVLVEEKQQVDGMQTLMKISKKDD